YSIENTQVYGVLFLGCSFDGGTRSLVGVATDRASGKGGNFTWIGGSGAGNQLADFSIGDPNGGAITIRDRIFERSARFLQTGGPSGAPFAVIIDGVRWAGDRLASDGIAIDFRFPGPLTIRNSRFGNDQNKDLKVSWTPGGAGDSGVFVFENNIVARAPRGP